MSVTVTLCGTNYSVPQQGDTTAWGTNLTSYLQALAAITYYLTPTASPAQSGIVRLATGDALAWRNNANSGDVLLSKGTVDQLQWAGVDLTGNPEAIYTTAAGLSIASSATPSIINYATQELDTAGAVTVGASWKFTVPAGKGGLYSVKASATWNAAITSGNMRLDLFKNGSLWRTLDRVVGGTNTPQLMLKGSTDIQLNATDFIDIRIQQNSGGAVVLTSTAAENAVAIHRLVS